MILSFDWYIARNILFIISTFVSADGKTIYLQDRAQKYNDKLGLASQNKSKFHEIPFRKIIQSLLEYQNHMAS